ncbi:MAG: chemotaxis protein CheW, partial [Haloarculaceae archaeon]
TADNDTPGDTADSGTAATAPGTADGGTAEAGNGSDTAGGGPVDEETAAVVQQIAQAASEAAAEDETDTADEPVDESVGAEMADAVEAVEEMTGIDLPDQEQLEAAGAVSAASSAMGGAEETTPAAPGVTEETVGTTEEESTRVLEFRLGDERYCLDITYVEEIVKLESITRVPNTPEYVEGVVDLRGQITTILDPKDMLDIDEAGDEDLIVVFDPDAFEEQGAIGWIVDEVQQVVPIVESEVNDPPVDEPYINGVVDREDEDEFVIWTEPDVALEEATGEGESED